MNNKIIFVSLITSAPLVVSGAIISEDMGTASGLIRLAYINQDNTAKEDTYATAIGGRLKYETAAWNNIKLGAAAYVSEKIGFASGENEKLNYDLLSSKKGSFTYIGEAYLDTIEIIIIFASVGKRWKPPLLTRMIFVWFLTVSKQL